MHEGTHPAFTHHARVTLLLEGGHIGRQRGALGARHGQHAHLAGLVQFEWHGVDAGRDLAADDVGVQRRAALVGHMGQGRADGLAQHHAQEVQLAARGRGAEVGLGRVGLVEGHQVFQVLVRAVTGGGNGQVKACQVGHRHEVGVGVVGQLFEHERRNDHWRQRRNEHGVAIGRRVLQGLGRDAPAGAGLGFHHHRGAQRGGQLFGHGARRGVDRAAGGKAHQQLDRAGLCLGRAQAGQRGQGQGREDLSCRIERHVLLQL